MNTEHMAELISETLAGAAIFAVVCQISRVLDEEEWDTSNVCSSVLGMVSVYDCR
jgi:hypothetical protein